MADGTFAVLLLVAGLTDMGTNYCGTATGCLGPGEQESRLSFSAGNVIERRAEEGLEVSMRYDFARMIGPFGQAVGLSWGEESGSWIGYGWTWGTTFGKSPFYTELHAMPGLYAADDDFDLGGPDRVPLGHRARLRGPQRLALRGELQPPLQRRDLR